MFGRNKKAGKPSSDSDEGKPSEKKISVDIQIHINIDNKEEPAIRTVFVGDKHKNFKVIPSTEGK